MSDCILPQSTILNMLLFIVFLCLASMLEWCNDFLSIPNFFQQKFWPQ